MKNISILIPSCSFPDLRQCVESIIKNTDLEKHDVEVIVCMNGCEIEAIDYIKSLGERFRFIWVDRRIGSCYATNLAAKISDAKYLMRMDEDVIVLDWGNQYWLDLLLAPFVDEKMAQVGPWLQHHFGYKTLVGFLYLTLREIWEKVGGLDVVFDPGSGEDPDYSIKVQQLGYKISGTLTAIEHWPIWHKGKASWWRLDDDDCRVKAEKILTSRYSQYGPRYGLNEENYK